MHVLEIVRTDQNSSLKLTARWNVLNSLRNIKVYKFKLMAYKKRYRKTYRKSYRKLKRRPNITEQGRTMTFTITKSVPLSALYTRPICFPLTIPGVVAVGTGQY